MWRPWSIWSEPAFELARVNPVIGPKKAVALLGYGAIGMSILALWKSSAVLDEHYDLATICCRPDQAAAAQAQLDGAPTQVVTSVADMLDLRPDVVIEAAGQTAIFQHGEDILRSGATPVLLSVGALANSDVHQALMRAASQAEVGFSCRPELSAALTR